LACKRVSNLKKGKGLKECEQCGASFVADKGAARFCSLKCNGAAKLGTGEAPQWAQCSKCLAGLGMGCGRAGAILGVNKGQIHLHWSKAGIVPTRELMELKIAFNRAKQQKLDGTANRLIMAEYRREAAAFVEWKATDFVSAYFLNHDKNREVARVAAKERHLKLFKVDPVYTAKRALRSIVSRMIKCTGQRKQRKSSAYLGCSLMSAKAHIESQFKPGMTWENHGQWEVDHIHPLDAFDLTDQNILMQASHYTNLQPLWKRDNRAKSNKIIPRSSIMQFAL
jgi:hypothetical protein